MDPWLAPKVRCPSCRSTGCAERLPRWKHANQLVLLALGVLPAMFWEEAKKTRYRCRNCEHCFGRRGPMARFAFVFFWIPFMLALLFVVWLIVLRP